MKKFGRNYELIIATPTGVLQVNPLLSVEFDITRNTLTSSNVCQLRIYNLAEANRNAVRKNENDFNSERSVIFRAGYGSNLPQVFAGDIAVAWSVREGPNFITQIECFDGGTAFVSATTNRTFPPGMTYAAVIAGVMNDLAPYGIKPGPIGNFPTVLTRQYVASGNTVDILRDLTNGGFFIDNGKAYALGPSEFADDALGIATVDSSTGLLGTPVLEESCLRFRMIFEPRLNVGQRVILNSATAANFNGGYKLTAVKHRGMISQSVAGEAITTAEFYFQDGMAGSF